MALRLLPTFLTDNDDDDGNFTKWMSSYWGHGAEGRRHGERKRSLRRPAAAPGDRRASLPTAVRDRLHVGQMVACGSLMMMQRGGGSREAWSYLARDSNATRNASGPGTVPRCPDLSSHRLTTSAEDTDVHAHAE